MIEGLHANRHAPSRRRRVLLVLVGIGLCAAAGTAAADEILQRGHDLLEANCSPCHAIGAEGASPLAAAPKFRELGERYAIANLEEALAEGIITGHAAMPELSFEPDDVGAIIAYLQSLQKS